MKTQTDILAAKFKRSSDLLRYRRLNWLVETNHRIRWGFEAFMREARASAVPLDFSLQQHDTPNEGVIQLMPHKLPIGVVNRRLDPFSEDESARDAVVIETGGELVASLSFMGHVHFIAHPRQSDRSTPKTKEIILAGPLDPTDVTPAVIRAVLRKYLLILRSSSVLGMEDTISVMERAQILWIYFADLRKTTQLARYVLTMTNEWAKVLAAGALGFLAAHLTASKP